MPEKIVPCFTCICATHNRPEVLPEAIESFQRQTYPYRELIILDDANQYPPQSGDRWHLVPIRHRFEIIGEKHDYAIRNFTNPHSNCIAIWDDDDIHLPNRLEVLAELLKNHDVAVCAKVGFQQSENLIDLIPAEDNHFHFGAYRLRAYYEVGGYKKLAVGEDKDLARRMFQAGLPFAKTDEIVQIYRWYSPYTHLATAKTQDDYDRRHSTSVARGGLIKPLWKENYTARIAEIQNRKARLQATARWHEIETNPGVNVDPVRYSCLYDGMPSPETALTTFRDRETKLLRLDRPSRITAGIMPTALFSDAAVRIEVNGVPFGQVQYPGETVEPFVLEAGNHLFSFQGNPYSRENRAFVSVGNLARETGRATPHNTIVLSTAAWPEPHEAVEVFDRSARRCGVPVQYLDFGAKWIDFYVNKILHYRKPLLEAKRTGKRFAFILDCRDIVVTQPLDAILSKFNGLYDNKVLFGADLIGWTWPCHSDRLLVAIQTANGFYAIPNAGFLAGEIDRILQLHDRAVEMHEELMQGYYRPGILREIAGNILPEYRNNDQFLFQILACYEKELIAVDTKKTLFAIFNGLFPELRKRRKEHPQKNYSVNDAPILHSPWLSENKMKWKAWAQENGLLEP